MATIVALIAGPASGVSGVNPWAAAAAGGTRLAIGEAAARPVDRLVVVPLAWDGVAPEGPMTDVLAAARAATEVLAQYDLPSPRPELVAPFALDATTAAPCDPAGWADALRAERGIAGDAIVAFVTPAAACARDRGWLGLAAGWRQAIAVTDRECGGRRSSVWLHELGHLLGLDEAGTLRCPRTASGGVDWRRCAPASPVSATADHGTVMGTCECGYAAHELLALGSPAAGTPIAIGVDGPETGAARLALAGPDDPGADPRLARLVRIRSSAINGELLVQYDAPGLPLTPPGQLGRGILRVRLLPAGGALTRDAAWIADVEAGETWTDRTSGLSIGLASGPSAATGIVVVTRT